MRQSSRFLLLLASILSSTNLRAGNVSVFDVIPYSMSGETGQNSEPSLAINPVNPRQIVLGAFSEGPGYFFSTLNGGSAWSPMDSFNVYDKTLSFSRDGRTIYTAYIGDAGGIALRAVNSAGASLGSDIDSYAFGDMPWVVTGRGLDPSSGQVKDRIYVAFNNTDQMVNGNSAMVRVSTDGGSTFSNVVIDRGAPHDFDNASVRVATNGDRVYGAFTRFTGVISSVPGNTYRHAEIVVVRDDQGAVGATRFGALGAGGGGTVVASVPWIDDFNGVQNNNRIGADLSMAVDPNNPNRVLVVYQSAPTASIANLVVAESLDGGVTWTTKTTLGAMSSALPAISILNDGTVGLLYETENLGFAESHFLVTRNDFADFTDTVLSHADKAIVPVSFQPYLGDYFDLQSAGQTFAGTFSAPNMDDGVLGGFPSGVTFFRSSSGAPGTASFAFNDGSGNAVGYSIDPFFFTQTLDPVPEPASLALLAGGFAALCLKGVMRRR